jgi:hypothetical protein
MEEIKRIIEDAEIMQEDDVLWPPPDRVGRRIDMSSHSATLSRFPANQSLFFLLHAVCLAEKQQIPIL